MGNEKTKEQLKQEKQEFIVELKKFHKDDWSYFLEFGLHTWDHGPIDPNRQRRTQRVQNYLNKLAQGDKDE